CDATTSPEILSLPVENSFIASAWPVAIARKSASDISSVHAGLPATPSVTLPGGADRSIVQLASGLASLNRNVVFTFSAVAGLAATNPPIARKISPLVGAAAALAAAPAAAAGLLRSLGLGSSFHSSSAAFEMQISPVSRTLQ